MRRLIPLIALFCLGCPRFVWPEVIFRPEKNAQSKHDQDAGQKSTLEEGRSSPTRDTTHAPNAGPDAVGEARGAAAEKPITTVRSTTSIAGEQAPSAKKVGASTQQTEDARTPEDRRTEHKQTAHEIGEEEDAPGEEDVVAEVLKKKAAAETAKRTTHFAARVEVEEGAELLATKQKLQKPRPTISKEDEDSRQTTVVNLQDEKEQYQRETNLASEAVLDEAVPTLLDKSEKIPADVLTAPVSTLPTDHPPPDVPEKSGDAVPPRKEEAPTSPPQGKTTSEVEEQPPRLLPRIFSRASVARSSTKDMLVGEVEQIRMKKDQHEVVKDNNPGSLGEQHQDRTSTATRDHDDKKLERGRAERTDHERQMNQRFAAALVEQDDPVYNDKAKNSDDSHSDSDFPPDSDDPSVVPLVVPARSLLHQDTNVFLADEDPSSRSVLHHQPRQFFLSPFDDACGEKESAVVNQFALLNSAEQVLLPYEQFSSATGTARSSGSSSTAALPQERHGAQHPTTFYRCDFLFLPSWYQPLFPQQQKCGNQRLDYCLFSSSRGLVLYDSGTRTAGLFPTHGLRAGEEMMDLYELMTFDGTTTVNANEYRSLERYKAELCALSNFPFPAVKLNPIHYYRYPWVRKWFQEREKHCLDYEQEQAGLLTSSGTQHEERCALLKSQASKHLLYLPDYFGASGRLDDGPLRTTLHFFLGQSHWRENEWWKLGMTETFCHPFLQRANYCSESAVQPEFAPRGMAEEKPDEAAAEPVKWKTWTPRAPLRGRTTFRAKTYLRLELEKCRITEPFYQCDAYKGAEWTVIWRHIGPFVADAMYGLDVEQVHTKFLPGTVAADPLRRYNEQRRTRIAHRGETLRQLELERQRQLEQERLEQELRENATAANATNDTAVEEVADEAQQQSAGSLMGNLLGAILDPLGRGKAATAEKEAATKDLRLSSEEVASKDDAATAAGREDDDDVIETEEEDDDSSPDTEDEDDEEDEEADPAAGAASDEPLTHYMHSVPIPDVWLDGAFSAFEPFVEEKKKLEEKEILEKNRFLTTAINLKEDLKKMEFDYANQAAGAKILDFAEGTTGASHVLRPDPAAYMLTPCSHTPSWFVIGLPEYISLEKVGFSSLEFFASQFRHLQILGSSSYPVERWRVLAEVELSLSETHQIFDVSQRCGRQENGCWVRFLKIRALSHYNLDGSVYCALTKIQVFGGTALKELDRQLEKEDEALSSQNLPVPNVQDVLGEYHDRENFFSLEPDLFLKRLGIFDTAGYLRMSGGTPVSSPTAVVGAAPAAGASSSASLNAGGQPAAAPVMWPSSDGSSGAAQPEQAGGGAGGASTATSTSTLGGGQQGSSAADLSASGATAGGLPLTGKNNGGELHPTGSLLRRKGSELLGPQANGSSSGQDGKIRSQTENGGQQAADFGGASASGMDSSFRAEQNQNNKPTSNDGGAGSMPYNSGTRTTISGADGGDSSLSGTPAVSGSATAGGGDSGNAAPSSSAAAGQANITATGAGEVGGTTSTAAATKSPPQTLNFVGDEGDYTPPIETSHPMSAASVSARILQFDDLDGNFPWMTSAGDKSLTNIGGTKEATNLLKQIVTLFDANAKRGSADGAGSGGEGVGTGSDPGSAGGHYANSASNMQQLDTLLTSLIGQAGGPHHAGADGRGLPTDFLYSEDSLTGAGARAAKALTPVNMPGGTEKPALMRILENIRLLEAKHVDLSKLSRNLVGSMRNFELLLALLSSVLLNVESATKDYKTRVERVHRLVLGGTGANERKNALSREHCFSPQSTGLVAAGASASVSGGSSSVAAVKNETLANQTGAVVSAAGGIVLNQASGADGISSTATTGGAASAASSPVDRGTNTFDDPLLCLLEVAIKEAAAHGEDVFSKLGLNPAGAATNFSSNGTKSGVTGAAAAHHLGDSPASATSSDDSSSTSRLLQSKKYVVHLLTSGLETILQQVNALFAFVLGDETFMLFPSSGTDNKGAAAGTKMKGGSGTSSKTASTTAAASSGTISGKMLSSFLERFLPFFEEKLALVHRNLPSSLQVFFSKETVSTIAEILQDEILAHVSWEQWILAYLLLYHAYSLLCRRRNSTKPEADHSYPSSTSRNVGTTRRVSIVSERENNSSIREGSHRSSSSSVPSYDREAVVLNSDRILIEDQQIAPSSRVFFRGNEQQHMIRDQRTAVGEDVASTRSELQSSQPGQHLSFGAAGVQSFHQHNPQNYTAQLLPQQNYGPHSLSPPLQFETATTYARFSAAEQSEPPATAADSHQQLSPMFSTHSQDLRKFTNTSAELLTPDSTPQFGAGSDDVVVFAPNNLEVNTSTSSTLKGLTEQSAFIFHQQGGVITDESNSFGHAEPEQINHLQTTRLYQGAGQELPGSSLSQQVVNIGGAASSRTDTELMSHSAATQEEQQEANEQRSGINPPKRAGPAKDGSPPALMSPPSVDKILPPIATLSSEDPCDVLVGSSDHPGQLVGQLQSVEHRGPEATLPTNDDFEEDDARGNDSSSRGVLFPGTTASSSYNTSSTTSAAALFDLNVKSNALHQPPGASACVIANAAATISGVSGTQLARELTAARSEQDRQFNRHVKQSSKNQKDSAQR
ncbi:unnamed protein product [Amoebophrya sp. A120]|nr:unnamed protein product [Amoebophrya sp. A120]|eukprot:GSA120T00005926001.1